MRTPSAKANSQNGLKNLISATTKLWRKHHLTYDEARYVSKEARRALDIERVKSRNRIVQRLSRDE
jgi:integrase/recombinase XerD